MNSKQKQNSNYSFCVLNCFKSTVNFEKNPKVWMVEKWLKGYITQIKIANTRSIS